MCVSRTRSIVTGSELRARTVFNKRILGAHSQHCQRTFRSIVTCSTALREGESRSNCVRPKQMANEHLWKTGSHQIWAFLGSPESQCLSCYYSSLRGASHDAPVFVGEGEQFAGSNASTHIVVIVGSRFRAWSAERTGGSINAGESSTDQFNSERQRWVDDESTERPRRATRLPNSYLWNTGRAC